jgi:RNA polymerase sigma-70 factor (ECF subfamily)
MVVHHHAHIFINNYRRRAKQNTIFDSTPNEFVELYQATIATAESNLKIKDITAAIHGLPEIFRNPFLLYFDGYKYHEIADMLHEPLGLLSRYILLATAEGSDRKVLNNSKVKIKKSKGSPNETF